MTQTPELPALLEQAPWIRSLAQSLVRDPHTADDLVQETWVSMLEHRPEAAGGNGGNGSLRGWMSTVLRNHLGKLRRGEGRRRGREQAVSRPESTPAALDVVQRAATHKTLVEAVLALDEPYRATILMRYFEQLSYAEIARRTGVAEATVNSRITRGLAQLRERLDREHGGREGLLAALIPICTAVRPEAAAAAATGASVLMSTPFQISVAAALSVASVVTVWQFTGAAAPSTSTAAARPVAGDPAIRAAELVIPRPLERGAVEPQRSEPAPLAAGSLAPDAAVDDDWVANLSQDHALGNAIKKLRVNTGAGDIEVREGAVGVVSIDAKISVDPDEVPAAALARDFAAHVKITEDGELLTIEDRHAADDDEGQWNVALALRVPPGLALTINSGAGDIRVLTVAGEVAVNSGAGDIAVEAADRRALSLAINSGAGDITVDVGAVETQLAVSSGAGDIDARLGRGTPTKGVRLSSGAGDIELLAPTDLVGEFKLESGIGEVVFPQSWGLELKGKGKGKGRQRASGQVGVGGPQHQLSTGSGDVKVSVGTVY